MKKIQHLASILIEGIRFTVDLPERHSTKKVPMLDLCGACSTKQKITILSEEVKRRLLNQDTRHSKEEREFMLKDFSQKLIDSGYTKEVRKEILASGVRRYYRLRLQDNNKVRNLYRTSEEMQVARSKKTGMTGAWF